MLSEDRARRIDEILEIPGDSDKVIAYQQLRLEELQSEFNALLWRLMSERNHAH
jgi:hypothetical protein